MTPLRILLIQHDEDDFVSIRDLLAGNRHLDCVVDRVAGFEAGLAALAAGGHEVCLLDDRLGARSALALLHEAQRLAVTAPIIVLACEDALAGDPQADLQALHAGAADYLVKSRLDAAGLQRAIRYALEARRRLQQRVQLIRAREAQAAAEAASRAKDEFVALVSHELRNPLNAILGWTEVLKRTGNDAGKLERAVAAIERSAQAQRRIIDDLLDSSRIAAGKLSLASEPVDPNEALEAALDVIRPSAASKQIALRFERAAACVVSGDRDRLQQVFWNLLSNAVKFTPDQGRIVVSMHSGAGQVSVRIADSGPGIEPAMHAKVFDRFRQLGGDGGARHSGLGLGLSLARDLVTAHGGSVVLHSPGEQGGATFVVTLPLAHT